MLRDDNRILKEKPAAVLEDNLRLRHQLFGSKSEQIKPGSIEIDVEENPEPPAPERKETEKKKDSSDIMKRTRRLRAPARVLR